MSEESFWKDRALTAEDALRSLTQCLAILCDRTDDNMIIITDAEMAEVDAIPNFATFHDKEKAEMHIRHVKE